MNIVTFKTLVSSHFWEFTGKNPRIAHGFAREFLRSGKRYRPGKVSKDAASLLVCTQKNFLLEGCGFTFRPPWPTLPGLGHQPLDGSIFLYWKLGYNPSLLILWMTCWGFEFKSYDLK